IAILASLITEYGFIIPQRIKNFIFLFDLFVLFSFILENTLKFFIATEKMLFIKRHWPDWAWMVFLFFYLASLFIELFFFPEFPPLLDILLITKVYILFSRMYLILKFLLERRTVKGFFVNLNINPAQTLAYSFLAAILAGTILLMLPAATAGGKGIKFVDALFTITSATCVTGLAVVDTGTYFTTFGQIIILIFIQLGGLGIMTFSAFFATIFGRGFGIRDRMIMQDVLDFTGMGEIMDLIKRIFKLTIAIEMTGAFILFLRFYAEGKGISWSAYNALFHSISAFCNAGFSLFSNNLEGYKGDIVVNLVITTLIILGGIGFPVLVNLQSYFFKREHRRHLGLQTKVVVNVSLSLIIAGAILLFISEFKGQIQNLPWHEKILTTYFQSVTTRTAGFNTINMEALSNGTLFIMIILMFIGASPGSTGGGIKTTTAAILFSTARGWLSGKDVPELFERTIPQDAVQKSFALLFIAQAAVAVVAFLLFLTEKAPFINILFEVVSAFGTVGLSTGLTPHLSDAGKLLISLMMYMGRIGPLTLALLVGQKVVKRYYYYPEEKVMIG
ncbi:MAG: TrkH family potassium uptake protein, partial [Nitrospirota bacterium]